MSQSVSEGKCLHTPKSSSCKRMHVKYQFSEMLPVGPVLSCWLESSRWLHSSAREGEGQKMSSGHPAQLAMSKSQRALASSILAPAAFCFLSKEAALPLCLVRKLPEGIEKKENNVQLENCAS